MFLETSETMLDQTDHDMVFFNIYINVFDIFESYGILVVTAVPEGEVAPVGAPIGLLAETEAEIEEAKAKATSVGANSVPVAAVAAVEVEALAAAAASVAVAAVAEAKVTVF